jgi:hypothetical protein
LSASFQLKPEWLDWFCDCLLRKVPISQIQHQLSLYGISEPQRFLEEVQNDPIFKWAYQQKKSLRQHQILINTQHKLRMISGIPSVDLLTEQAFFEHFYSSQTPVIIEKWVTQWPAYQKWSASFLRDQYGDAQIKITQGREGHEDYDIRSSEYQVDGDLYTFAQRVMDTTHSNDFYLIARNRVIETPTLQPLWTDVIEAPYLDPHLRKGCAALWFGPKGTITPLHHDTCNILFAQVWGDKRITLIPPTYLKLFETSKSMYSFEDVKQSPLKEETFEVTLKAGQALFIPVGWWHQVEALSASISLAMTHFRRRNDFDDYRPGAV